MPSRDNAEDRPIDADGARELDGSAEVGCCRYDTGATTNQIPGITHQECVDQAAARGGTNVSWTRGSC